MATATESMMNAKPRKTRHKREPIHFKATVADAISDAQGRIEELKDEIESWKENMEEKFSQTSKYEELSESLDNLETTVGGFDSIDVDEIGDASDQTVELDLPNKAKQSRADRMSDAIALLEEAKSVVESRKEDFDQASTDIQEELDAREGEVDADVKNEDREHPEPEQPLSMDQATWDTDVELLTKAQLESFKADVDDWSENCERAIDALDEVISSAGEVSFPGMY